MPFAPCLEKASLSESVLVLDWDDTLMCSSWISRASLLTPAASPVGGKKSPVGALAAAALREPSVVLPEAQRELRHLAEAVRGLLLRARELLPKDRIIIVTNSEAGWVQLSAAAFLRPALSALGGLRIVSARSAFESFFPDQPACWKAAAFAYEIREILDRDGAGSVRRIVSVGDGFQERDGCAITCAQFGIQGVSVRMMPMPTPRLLCHEIDAVSRSLVELCVSEHGWMEVGCAPARKSIELCLISKIAGQISLAGIDGPAATPATPAEDDEQLSETDVTETSEEASDSDALEGSHDSTSRMMDMLSLAAEEVDALDQVPRPPRSTHKRDRFGDKPAASPTRPRPPSRYESSPRCGERRRRRKLPGRAADVPVLGLPSREVRDVPAPPPMHLGRSPSFGRAPSQGLRKTSVMGHRSAPAPHASCRAAA